MESRTYNNILVRGENAFYALADARLLHRISGVREDKFNEGQRVWFVDRCQEVEDALKEIGYKYR